MILNNTQTCVEIDDNVAKLIEEINSSPNNLKQVNFIDDFQKMMIDQLMGPFGLTRAMFEDKDGGAITTIHNFEKGVVATDSDAEKYENWTKAKQEKFDSTDYKNKLNEVHPDLQSKDGKYNDEYRKPNSEIPAGPRMAARDHVVSACEIERSASGHLAQSKNERVDTASQDKNIVLTTFSANSSKQEKDLMEWASSPNSKEPKKSNAEYYDLDLETVEKVYKEAKEAVNTTQNNAVFNKQSKEFLIEGSKSAGKLVLRQILGLLLKDLITGLIEDVRFLVDKGVGEAKSLSKMIKQRINVTWERVKEKWAEYLKEGIFAGLSGFFSTLVTLIINSFITTAKNIVRLIREAILSILRAIKTIATPPKNATGGEIALEVMKILSSAVAISIGIALEEVISNAMLSIPFLAPFASTIAPIITGILTGSLTLLTILAFDKIKSKLEFRNKEMADIHRGQTINFLKIKETAFLLTAANVHLEHVVVN